jgi:IclR family transcriptional regulator, acetate operon repressor
MAKMDKDLNGRVQSVDRAMLLLEALGEDDRGHRLTDLSRRTGLSLTTVHRLLTTLEHRRFVQFSASDNLWHIGLQAFAVGSAFVRDRNFVAPALPFLRQLRDQTRETANLGVVEDGEIVLVNQVESREITRAISRVGGRTPMTASGMGKAVLASYTHDDISSVIKSRGMRKVTGKTLTSREALEAQLDQTRRDGYAVDDEEFIPGLRCVAAPVYDNRSEVVCAISVSGLPLRMTPERIPVLGGLIAQTAAELTRALGGCLPVR